LAYIAAQEESGHFNASKSPILNNPYNFTEIRFETIEAENGWYDFPNRQESSYRTVSSMVSLPNSKNVKGVVAYFFPATFDKSTTPSARKNKLYRVIAALYAAQNYAVVFSDHLGMGLDSNHTHPYLLYPQQQAKAGIYILN
jgi:antibiotic biosynthesis monooxygenase (ABM) superfamily enzyme